MSIIEQLYLAIGQFSISAQTAAAVKPGTDSMMAESPFNTYIAGVVIYTFAVAFLVAVMLIGGLLVVNLGMMSRRKDDYVGGRTPGDVGLLTGSLWPLPTEDRDRYLPAEEDEDESFGTQVASSQPEGHDLEDPRRADRGHLRPAA